MSLNWNVEKCKDWKILTNNNESDKPKDTLEWTITNSVIWLSMTCGFNEITKKNYKEIWFKINLWETYKGSYISVRTKKGTYKKYFITLEDIKKRIGLSTNASRETLKQNFTKLLKHLNFNNIEGIENNRFSK